MAQKNQPETGDWRKKLGHLDVLPDSPPLDTTILWKKFRSRPLKKKRSAGYYAIVAAVMFAAVFTIPILTADEQHPDKLTVQETIQPEPKPVIPQESKTQTSQPKVLPKRKQSFAGVKHKVQKRLVPTVVTPVAMPDVEISMPDTIATASIAATAPVKRIKVIHINEINPGKGTAGTENQVMKSYALRRPSDNIIKINLPSN